MSWGPVAPKRRQVHDAAMLHVIIFFGDTAANGAAFRDCSTIASAVDVISLCDRASPDKDGHDRGFGPRALPRSRPA